ncbi:MAG: ABC transporter permease [Thermoflexales bacterium]|nr:ABC transporter permease [Thermoflexales bacterium]
MNRPFSVIASRVFSYLFSLWVIMTLNFLLPRLLPGDPLAALLDPSSSDYVFDPQVRAALAAYYGLDRPLPEQYGRYLLGALTGDLGRSIRLNRPVAELIASHLPWTLLLVGTALLFSSILALLGGAEAAWRRGSRTDRTLVATSTLLANVPVYLTGMLLLLLFGARLKWLPMAGGRTPFARYTTALDAALDVGRHLVLPALTLTLGMLGAKFLLVRNTTVTVLGEDFMLVARAKGLPEGRLKWGHALRNAVLPFVAQMAAHAGMAVTGAVFIETLFNYPGMGRLIFESVTARDYPVIQGVFLVVSAVVLTANLLADLLNARLDPRVQEAQ